MRREYYQKYELTPKASIKPKPLHIKPPAPPSPVCNTNHQSGGLGDFFKNIGSDEILIAALIIALITDDEPDLLTVFALIFILMT